VFRRPCCSCRRIGNSCQAPKKYARQIGLNAEQFSAHSLRAGFITSAAKSGAGLFKIMNAFRHRSAETVRCYVRDAELFQDHAGQDFL
jgi:integrase